MNRATNVVPSWDELAIPISSGLERVPDEERHKYELTKEEQAELLVILDDIDRHTVLNQWWLRQ